MIEVISAGHALRLVGKQHTRYPVHDWQVPTGGARLAARTAPLTLACPNGTRVQTLLCNLYSRGWDAEARQPARASVRMAVDHAAQSFISLYLYGLPPKLNSASVCPASS